ncbi:hypothetical protein [Ancylomarina euxinus]|nr:hypothetical protein [Ancylomarina euxinus]MCZ4694705.1 hypothetical protein [Ancylomarina euxinus]MUP16369.1 hypothetical protein [Ancylomarina euxinus]
MKNLSDEASAKYAFILVGIVGSILAVLTYFGIQNTEKKQEYIRKNGERTLAFYSRESGQMSSVTYWFEFKLDGDNYESSLHGPFAVPPTYPFKQVPILVAYYKSDPSQNITLPEEAFDYKGYRICWLKFEDSLTYYMDIRKLD